jgi:hypothetical protein
VLADARTAALKEAQAGKANCSLQLEQLQNARKAAEASMLQRVQASDVC